MNLPSSLASFALPTATRLPNAIWIAPSRPATAFSRKWSRTATSSRMKLTQPKKPNSASSAAASKAAWLPTLWTWSRTISSSNIRKAISRRRASASIQPSTRNSRPPLLWLSRTACCKWTSFSPSATPFGKKWASPLRSPRSRSWHSIRTPAKFAPSSAAATTAKASSTALWRAASPARSSNPSFTPQHLIMPPRVCFLS